MDTEVETDPVSKGQRLREELVKRGYVGSRIHSSRASVFSHPDAGDHEFFLRFRESNDVTLDRFDNERKKIMESLAGPSLA
jgi:hypothetical protein